MRRAAVGAALVAVVASGCSTDTEDDAVPDVTGAPTSASATPSAPAASRPPRDAHRLGLQAVAALTRDAPRRALALIARGADVNAQDAIEDSTFLYAGAEGYVEVVRAALAHGADTRVLNRYGGTALIPASEHAHLDVIRLLLSSSDVEVDHVNELGGSARGEAVGLGTGGPRSLEAGRLLLVAGADPTVRDRFGRTVLENAERLGYDEIAALLRRR